MKQIPEHSLKKALRWACLAACAAGALVPHSQAQYKPEEEFAKGQKDPFRAAMLKAFGGHTAHSYYNMLMQKKEGRVHDGGPVICNERVEEGFAEGQIALYKGLYNEEQVALPRWLEGEVKDLNEQLRRKLAPADFLEILKGEQAMALYYTSLAEFKQDHGDSLRERLQAILSHPEDELTFRHACFGGSRADLVALKADIRQQTDQIIYGDADFIVTQDQGPFGKGSARLTFWSSSTYKKVTSFCIPTELGEKARVVTAIGSGIYLIRTQGSYPISYDERMASHWSGEMWASYLVDPRRQTHQTLFGDGINAAETTKQRSTGSLFRKFEEWAKKNGLTQPTVNAEANTSSAGMQEGQAIATSLQPVGVDALAYSTNRGACYKLNLHTLSRERIARSQISISDTARNAGTQLRNFVYNNICGAQPFRARPRVQSLADVMGNAEDRRKIDNLFNALTQKAQEDWGEDTDSATNLRYLSFTEHLIACMHEQSNMQAFHASHMRAEEAASPAAQKYAAGITALRDRQGKVQVLPSLRSLAQTGATGTLRELDSFPHQNNPAPGPGDKNDYTAPASARYFDFGDSNDGGLTVHSLDLTHDAAKDTYYLTLQTTGKEKTGAYWVLEIAPRQGSVKTLYYSDGIAEATCPIYLPKGPWVLSPLSSQSYSILKTEGDTFQKVATLHLCENDDYVIILPDGRFGGSPGCEQYLEYNTPQGCLDMTPFAHHFNRPGDVLAALGGAPDDIEALRRATKRWQGKATAFAAPQLQHHTLPAAKLLTPAELESAEDTQTLSLELQAAPKVALTTLHVYVDGVRISQEFDNSLMLRPGEKKTVSVRIPLSDGQNNVQIYPVDSMGIPGTAISYRTLYNTTHTPRLFLVALGVSDYANDELDLQYAAKDARDIEKAIKECTYLEARTLCLTDADVPDAGVLDKVKQHLADARPDDTVVFYLAGHGMLDDKLEYYYAPHHFDADDMHRTGISMQAITSCLQQTQSQNRLLLLDTCHSGNVGEAEMDQLAANGISLPHGVRAIANRGMKVKKVSSGEQMAAGSKKRYLEEFFSSGSDTKGITVLAAASGAQFAQESQEWNNGLFTCTFIDVLRHAYKGDTDCNGRLSISELVAHIQLEVNLRTRGLQVPNATVAQAAHLSYLPFRYPNPPINPGIKLSHFTGAWDRSTALQFAQLLREAMESPHEKDFAKLFDAAVECPVENKTKSLYDIRKAHFDTLLQKGSPRVLIEQYAYSGQTIRLKATLAYAAGKGLYAAASTLHYLIEAKINEKGRLCSWMMQETAAETTCMSAGFEGPFTLSEQQQSLTSNQNRQYFNFPKASEAPEPDPGYVFIPAKKQDVEVANPELYIPGRNGDFTDEQAIAWAERFLAAYAQNNDKPFNDMLDENPQWFNYRQAKEKIQGEYAAMKARFSKRQFDLVGVAKGSYTVYIIYKATLADTAGTSQTIYIQSKLSISSKGKIDFHTLSQSSKDGTADLAKYTDVEIVSGTGKKMHSPDAQNNLSDEQAHTWARRLIESMENGSFYFVDDLCTDPVNDDVSRSRFHMNLEQFWKQYPNREVSLVSLARNKNCLHIVMAVSYGGNSRQKENDVPLFLSDSSSSSSTDSSDSFYSSSFDNEPRKAYVVYTVTINERGKITHFNYDSASEYTKPGPDMTIVFPAGQRSESAYPSNAAPQRTPAPDATPAPSPTPAPSARPAQDNTADIVRKRVRLSEPYTGPGADAQLAQDIATTCTPTINILPKNILMNRSELAKNIKAFGKSWPERSYQVLGVARNGNVIEIQVHYSCHKPGKSTSGYSLFTLMVNDSGLITSMGEKTANSAPPTFSPGMQPVPF